MSQISCNTINLNQLANASLPSQVDHKQQATSQARQVARDLQNNIADVLKKYTDVIVELECLDHILKRFVTDANILNQQYINHPFYVLDPKDGVAHITNPEAVQFGDRLTDLFLTLHMQIKAIVAEQLVKLPELATLDWSDFSQKSSRAFTDLKAKHSRPLRGLPPLNHQLRRDHVISDIARAAEGLFDQITLKVNQALKSSVAQALQIPELNIEQAKQVWSSKLPSVSQQSTDNSDLVNQYVSAADKSIRSCLTAIVHSESLPFGYKFDWRGPNLSHFRASIYQAIQQLPAVSFSLAGLQFIDEESNQYEINMVTQAISNAINFAYSYKHGLTEPIGIELYKFQEVLKHNLVSLINNSPSKYLNQEVLIDLLGQMGIESFDTMLALASEGMYKCATVLNFYERELKKISIQNYSGLWRLGNPDGQQDLRSDLFKYSLEVLKTTLIQLNRTPAVVDTDQELATASAAFCAFLIAPHNAELVQVLTAILSNQQGKSIFKQEIAGMLVYTDFRRRPNSLLDPKDAERPMAEELMRLVR